MNLCRNVHGPARRNVPKQELQKFKNDNMQFMPKFLIKALQHFCVQKIQPVLAKHGFWEERLGGGTARKGLSRASSTTYMRQGDKPGDKARKMSFHRSENRGVELFPDCKRGLGEKTNAKQVKPGNKGPSQFLLVTVLNSGGRFVETATGRKKGLAETVTKKRHTHLSPPPHIMSFIWFDVAKGGAEFGIII